MSLRINISKRISIPFLVIFVLLVACETPFTDNTSPTINLTAVNGTAQSAAATLLAQTMTAIPSDRPSPTPTRTPLPFMVLDGLRVTYIIDGNLYVQDSGKQAIQLTRGVIKDRTPLLSSDGQKVIYYRQSRSNMNKMWVINADGTNERMLVGLEQLAVFGQNYDTTAEILASAFVPDTHQLLFSTQTRDLLLVDTNTGELKQLVMPGQGGYFLISPNGKWVAVQALDHISVIDIQGNSVLNNLVRYNPNGYDNRVKWAPMFWTQASNELIVVQPAPFNPTSDLEVMARSVWRYPVDGRPGVGIRLNPPPLYDALSVSPDGNWITYSYDLGILDPNSTRGVYLGNLRDGSSQLLYTPQPDATRIYPQLPKTYNGWSTDSINVIFTDDRNRIYMGNIHGEVVAIGKGLLVGFGWIDNKRYVSGGLLGEVGKQGFVRTIDIPTDFAYYNPISFVFLGH